MTSPTENTAFDPTRLDKIRALQDKGITIFPSSFDRQHTVLDIKTKYADITHDKSAERVSTA
jgi:lysyl-tRNA synthetase class 2